MATPGTLALFARDSVTTGIVQVEQGLKMELHWVLLLASRFILDILAHHQCPCNLLRPLKACYSIIPSLQFFLQLLNLFLVIGSFVSVFQLM